jgi:hypothetical protein
MIPQRDLLIKHLEGSWENKKKGYKINIIEKVFPKYYVNFIPPMSIKNETFEHDEVEIRFGKTNTELSISSSMGTWYLDQFSEHSFVLIPFNPEATRVEKCCFTKVKSETTRQPFT